MAQAQYPYLDLTVMPQMRDHVISPRAAILFSTDLRHILWTNGEGAQLIGADTIRAALEGDCKPDTVMMRQIAVAAQKLDTASEARANIRLKQGFKTRLLGYSVSEMTLPDGKQAILLVSDRMHGRRHPHDEMAQSAVDGLDGYSHAAAVLDARGGVIAMSRRFEELGLEGNDLAALTQDVAGEDDRLIKRHVDTKNGNMPAGIARLTDNPALHLLVLADVSEESVAPSKPAHVALETIEVEKQEPATAEPQSIDEVSPPPRQFSNRRENPGRNRLNRWYYKKDPEQEPESVEFLEFEEEVSVLEEPARPDAVVTIPEQPSLKGVLEPVTLSTTSNDEATANTENDYDGVADSDNATAENFDNFRFKASAEPVRFVWEMDGGSAFVSVSDELAAAVGPKSANVTGLTWEEVGQTRGLVNAQEISTLLEKGDTWSGKTVLWPVQETDLRVPVDLAGLPSFDRNRAFDGFSGFGIIRTADAVIDPEGGGFSLSGVDADQPQEPDDDFGPESEEIPEDGGEVVDFGTRKSMRPDRELSSDEQSTFDEIAQRLADAKVEQPTQKPRSVEPIERVIEPFTPSAFAKRVIDEHDAGPQPAPKEIADDQVDTSILARLPIPVLVYRGNDMLFGNDEFFHLTGYADLRDLAKRGGVNALFGLVDKPGDEDEAIIYHRDGSQLNVSAHLQRVPWDNQRAMLLTLRRNGGGPGDRRPVLDEDKSSTSSPTEDSPESRTIDSSEELRPSIADTAPISLVLDDDPVERQPAAKPNPVEVKSVEPELHIETPAAPPATPPIAEVWLDQSDRTPSKAFGGLTGDDMRGILDVATDGTIILSNDGTVRAINRSAEALFDVRPEQIEGKSITKLLALESHRIALDYLSGLTGTGVASLLNDGREIIGQTEKGGLIPLFMTIGKLENSDACCAVVRDITHFKKAEDDLVAAKAQAESANALKSDFLTKISHEVRTPLNAIIGFSDIMIEERFGRIDNDRYRGYLRDIRRSGNHVLDLVNDLLDISKIESGKIDLEFDACELNGIVSDAVAMTQPAASKEQIIVRTSLSAVVPKVVADPRSIRQVVLNIVSNAIKFTKQGGQVIVSTVYDENGEVVLRIRDTGVGMNDLELARAMKPFQQVGPLSVAHKQGTGLGLPLTKAIVEANRARFHIESAPGEGTLVEIHFPIQRVLADH